MLYARVAWKSQKLGNCDCVVWYWLEKWGCSLEEATGLTFRFVIGKTKDKAKMAELAKEVAKFDDFLLLDIEEEYSKLPYKTLVLEYL